MELIDLIHNLQSESVSNTRLEAIKGIMPHPGGLPGVVLTNFETTTNYFYHPRTEDEVGTQTDFYTAGQLASILDFLASSYVGLSTMFGDMGTFDNESQVYYLYRGEDECTDDCYPVYVEDADDLCLYTVEGPVFYSEAAEKRNEQRNFHENILPEKYDYYTVEYAIDLILENEGGDYEKLMHTVKNMPFFLEAFEYSNIDVENTPARELYEFCKMVIVDITE